MFQPTSNISADFGPIQLSLFASEFGGSGCDSANEHGQALKLAGDELPSPVTELLCPQAFDFMRVFEAVSGWEVHFRESAASCSRRAQVASVDDTSASESIRPEGEFEIIDMSSEWPAKTPTMHRGMCDQLVKIYSDLYSQSNANQDSYDKVRGLLEALTGPAEESGELADSFVPMVAGLVEDDGSDFVLEQGGEFDEEFDSTFVVRQQFDSKKLARGGVWDDWSFAGATGLVGNAYLDWAQHGDMLTVYVGQIESSFGVGDTESSLEVNALSQQFKVSEGNTLAAFFFWDRRGGRLQSVEPGSWQTLYSEGAIIISTDPNVQMPDSVVNARLSDAPFTASQLAAAIETKLGPDHRVLVIKCD